MDTVIKVLQVNGHAIMNRGVEAFLMNVYRNIDRTKVQFHFLTPLDCRNEEMKKEIIELGGSVHELRCKDHKIWSKVVLFKLYLFLRRNKYDIVHINTGNIVFLSIAVLASKLSGVPRIIAHSHNSADMKTGLSKKSWKNYICSPILRYCPTDYWTCSMKAGEYMFPRNVIKNNIIRIIHNGINVELYDYKQEIRNETREFLVYEDKFIVGHIGQFVKQKNHIYLLDIFEEIHRRKSNAILLLIGEGENKTEIEALVKKKHLEKEVCFFGITNEIPKLLMAMDVFVLPSLFEGLPVVGIEAQASGLKCFISDRVSNELDITGNVSFLSITELPSVWADKIVTVNTDSRQRNGMMQKIIEANYCIKNVAKILEANYCTTEII
jgi:glycosyltransferase involved in cell wall biosynthesis